MVLLLLPHCGVVVVTWSTTQFHNIIICTFPFPHTFTVHSSVVGTLILPRICSLFIPHLREFDWLFTHILLLHLILPLTTFYIHCALSLLPDWIVRFPIFYIWFHFVVGALVDLCVDVVIYYVVLFVVVFFVLVVILFIYIHYVVHLVVVVRWTLFDADRYVLVIIIHILLLRLCCLYTRICFSRLFVHLRHVVVPLTLLPRCCYPHFAFTLHTHTPFLHTPLHLPTPLHTIIWSLCCDFVVPHNLFYSHLHHTFTFVTCSPLPHLFSPSILPTFVFICCCCCCWVFVVVVTVRYHTFIVVICSILLYIVVVIGIIRHVDWNKWCLGTGWCSFYDLYITYCLSLPYIHYIPTVFVVGVPRFGGALFPHFIPFYVIHTFTFTFISFLIYSDPSFTTFPHLYFGYGWFGRDDFVTSFILRLRLLLYVPGAWMGHLLLHTTRSFLYHCSFVVIGIFHSRTLHVLFCYVVTFTFCGFTLRCYVVVRVCYVYVIVAYLVLIFTHTVVLSWIYVVDVAPLHYRSLTHFVVVHTPHTHFILNHTTWPTFFVTSFVVVVYVYVYCAHRRLRCLHLSLPLLYTHHTTPSPLVWARHLPTICQNFLTPLIPHIVHTFICYTRAWALHSPGGRHLHSWWWEWMFVWYLPTSHFTPFVVVVICETDYICSPLLSHIPSELLGPTLFTLHIPSFTSLHHCWDM